MLGLTRTIALVRNRGIILLAGLAILAGLVLLYVFQPSLFVYLDHKIYDQLLRGRSPAAPAGVVQIVDIDEQSLAAYGQWPWPRYRLAMLLARIQQAGAASIGLDILLAEPDRTSPELLVDDLKRDLGLDVHLQGLPPDLDNNDEVLGNVLASGPCVLGYYFDFREAPGEGGSPPPKGLTPLNTSYSRAKNAAPPPYPFLEPAGVVPPLDVLSKRSRSGFYNTITDEDGIIRRVPLLVSWRGNIYPSLSLATLMQALGTENALVKVSASGPEELRLAGKLLIPINRQGLFLINYRGGARTFPYVSASDVLAGTVPPETFQGRIVLVGTSAAGLFDLKATPFGPNTPGVEAHATVIDNIMQQDFIIRPDWAPGLEITVMLLAGAATVLLITWTRAIYLILPMAALFYGLWWGAEHAMRTQRLFVSPLYPYLGVGLIFMVLTFLKFLSEERQRRYIHNAFSHYVAPSVVTQIMRTSKGLTLSGEEKDVTILFSDIRSFTSLSETLTPNQVTEFLHAYLTPMTRIVTRHKGTVDKFIGDAVMAFWNAPLDLADHPCLALQAGLDMVAELDRLNQDFQERFGFTIRIGIGIHTGLVRVGNMGSEDLFDYTLIGDNVNLASRLEGLTKYYVQQLVVSEDVQRACRDRFTFLELDRVRVKGRKQPITIYTLREMDDRADAELLALHARAMECYRQGDFAQAALLFQELQQASPEQYCYRLFQERCRTLIQTPPEGEWDGVFKHTEK